MIKTEINCDSCGRKLNEPTNYEADYYVRLVKASAPRASGFCYAVHVHPPIDDDMEFCGLGCLKNWLKKKEQPTPQTRYERQQK